MHPCTSCACSCTGLVQSCQMKCVLTLLFLSSCRIVRNSWGVTWGQAGYIYLEYGKNMCNLASDATVVKGCAIV